VAFAENKKSFLIRGARVCLAGALQLDARSSRSAALPLDEILIKPENPFAAAAVKWPPPRRFHHSLFVFFTFRRSTLLLT
jgi:hypothetical protein